MERYTSIKQNTKGLFIMCGDFLKATFTSLCFASVQLDLVISHRRGLAFYFTWLHDSLPSVLMYVCAT